MKQLNANEMIDFLDGTLTPERMAQVEAHLQNNVEDAALIADLKMAHESLIDLEAAEPIRASDDFWIKVRNGLPERAPKRSFFSQARGWFAPSPMRLSVGIAAIVAFLAIAFSAFGPNQSKNTTVAGPKADPITAEFKRSIADGKFRSQPLSGAIPQRGVVGPQADRPNDAARDEETPADHTP